MDAITGSRWLVLVGGATVTECRTEWEARTAAEALRAAGWDAWWHYCD